MATTITIPAKYGWVLLASAAIGLQCYMTGFIMSHKKRNKHFNKKYLEENFSELHKKSVGDFPLPAGGYPDMGNGRYSEKLKYEDWFDFNNGLRVHQNYVENVGVLIPATLIAGLKFPRAAAIAGAIHLLGRTLYAAGYSSKQGGDKREAGAVMAHGSTGVNVILSIVAAVKIAKGL